jgi:predicted hydrolase (HD superfamily)
MEKESAKLLLREYITTNSLINHSHMVAIAMQAYAQKQNKDEKSIHDWWLCGLLHDIDWEAYPDQHPNYAVEHILPKIEVTDEIKHAILAHAPERSGILAESEMDCYLFACDELSGFIHAVSLLRPTGYEGMKVKSVTKKLKTPNFAANVSRDDIYKGVELIGTTLADHILFLIDVFQKAKEKHLIE